MLNPIQREHQVEVFRSAGNRGKETVQEGHLSYLNNRLREMIGKKEDGTKKVDSLLLKMENLSMRLLNG